MVWQKVSVLQGVTWIVKLDKTESKSHNRKSDYPHLLSPLMLNVCSIDLYRCENLKTSGKGWARSFDISSHQGTLIYFTKSEATSQSSSFTLMLNTFVTKISSHSYHGLNYLHGTGMQRLKANSSFEDSAMCLCSIERCPRHI